MPTAIPSLLVIDDDEVMRELLTLTLAADAGPILTAASGAEALALLAKLPRAQLPAIILTDLQMPGLTGTALATELRAATPPATRLIAMSGSQPPATQTKPFDAFLLKPFTPQDFTAALTAAFTAAFAAALTAAPPTPAPATTDPLNETVYAKLASAMPAAQLTQLYTLCFDDALTRIAAMRTAADASDADAYTRQAHAIKGGCGMLGATHLHALASAMETGALQSTPLLEDFTHALSHLRRMLEARS